MIFSKFIKLVFLCLITVLVAPNLKAETKDQHIKVTLRAIGHEFLLELGDNNSRVLPIEKIDGRYALKFEKKFSFLPGQLVFVISEVFKKSAISDGYIVEVEQCTTSELVYSAEININQEEPYPACQERELPEDCYTFYFTLVENETTDSTVLNETNRTEITNTLGVHNKEKNARTFFIYSLVLIIFLLATVGFIYFRTKKKQPKANSDLLQIGKFQFDQKGMRLLLEAEIIELSGKEADLLFLLFTNESKTLEREYILKMVWGDEGDYVGRTLDVFVSKLRKKLETDAQLKIINIRGVGYKFVVN